MGYLIPYYYDRNLELQYQPKLVKDMTDKEKAAHVQNRCYDPCHDCTAPTSVAFTKCDDCAQRYDTYQPTMLIKRDYHDGLELTPQYIRRMRDIERVKENQRAFIRQVGVLDDRKIEFPPLDEINRYYYSILELVTV